MSMAVSPKYNMKKTSLIFILVLFIMTSIYTFHYYQFQSKQKQLNLSEQPSGIMPEIIFECHQSLPQLLEETKYDHWAIDRNGNIYYSHYPNINFEQADASQYQRIASIDTSLLQKQYTLVQQIAESNNYQLLSIPNEWSDPTYDIEYGEVLWTACCYDKNGKKIEIELYKENSSKYYNTNPYAHALAIWFESIICQYKEYTPYYILKKGNIHEKNTEDNHNSTWNLIYNS